jgi:hypothetical protein
MICFTVFAMSIPMQGRPSDDPIPLPKIIIFALTKFVQKDSKYPNSGELYQEYWKSNLLLFAERTIDCAAPSFCLSITQKHNNILDGDFLFVTLLFSQEASQATVSEKI